MQQQVDRANERMDESRRTGGHTGSWMLLGACLIAWASGITAAEAQDAVIVPRLRQGDEFRLEITHTGHRWDLLLGMPSPLRKATVDVRVVFAGDDGLLLEWLPSVTSYATDDPRAQRLLIRLDSKWEGDRSGQ